MKDYKEMTPDQLLKKILPYKHYFQSSNGGVTLSGGDPIIQPNFVEKFFTLCKKENIHTTIDTSCLTTQETLDKLMPVTDLWMISLKHFNEKTHLKLTGQSNKQILENIKYLSRKKAHIRFRYVILTGWTDTWLNLRALKKFLKTVKFQEIELLPYHTYGIYKWEKLGLHYKLKGTKPPKESSIQKIKKMLEKEGYNVVVNET
jgi:pyruvate formate lyase activating enzyme